MMKKITIVLVCLTLSFCSFSMSGLESSLSKKIQNCSYKLEKNDFSFLKYSPTKKIINGSVFPRSTEHLFRSAAYNSQFPIPKVIRAMLGDKGANFGTRLVDQWAKYFSGQSDTYEVGNKKLSGIALELVLEAGTCLVVRDLSLVDAYQLANDINSKILRFIEKREENNLKSCLDYNNCTNGPGWGVFTSVFPTSADCYGPSQVLVEDRERRSLALAYYNYALSGEWTMGRKTYPDYGEHISPGMLKYNEIKAYYEKTGSNKWLTWHVDRKIKYAFMKMETTQEGEFIAIVKGDDHSRCIIAKGEKLYFCKTDYKSGGVEPEASEIPFILSSISPKVLGVIKKCNTKNDPSCVNSSWLRKNKINQDEKLELTLPLEVLEQIKSINKDSDGRDFIIKVLE